MSCTILVENVLSKKEHSIRSCLLCVMNTHDIQLYLVLVRQNHSLVYKLWNKPIHALVDPTLSVLECNTSHTPTDWEDTKLGSSDHMHTSPHLLTANHTPLLDPWLFLANHRSRLLSDIPIHTTVASTTVLHVVLLFLVEWSLCKVKA